MKSFETVWRRVKTRVNRVKNNLVPRLRAKTAELHRRYGPAMNAIRHADVLIANWRGYPSLVRKARTNIKRAKKLEIVSSLVRDIEYGRVLWIPIEKRAGALLFVELCAGGVEVEASRLRKLGLDKYDVEALEQLVKNSL
ncbi:Uncharacterised protein [uncultured archaeon]|nr:Uncharacterised protein [uncultured archaeon]